MHVTEIWTGHLKIAIYLRPVQLTALLIYGTLETSGSRHYV